MTGRLKDKVVLLVGAGSIGSTKPIHGNNGVSALDPGLSNGAACALTYAREGAAVLCVDRSLAAARQTAERIAQAGGRASAFEADIRRASDIEAAVADCLKRYGRIDVLHNNVGIEAMGGLTELTEESWDLVHDVNLKGAMLTCRNVVPLMIAQGGGSIINISSVASLVWSPTQYLSYSTSKAALNHMTRVLARQYAPNQIRCNAILPGLIDTPHVAVHYPSAEEVAKARAARARRCPMGRQGSPWDVANAALFLASDESKYVTGIEMVVDGGLTL